MRMVDAVLLWLVARFLSFPSCLLPSFPERKIALMKPLVWGLFTLPISAISQSVETLHVFDDQLHNGFENWSWANNSLEATAEVRAGSASASVDYQAWDGLYFGMPGSVGLPTFGTLEFSVYAQDSLPIGVALVGADGVAGETVTITPTPGQWNDVSLSLSDLGVSGSFSGVWWQNGTDTPRATAYIDEVKIVAEAPPRAVAGPSLAVLPGAQQLTRSVTDPASGVSSDRTVNFPHAISDDVYGMNFAPDVLREELGLTVNRWGGNSTERYNHLIGSTNTAHDWFFMSNPEEPGGDHRFEEGNEEDGTKTLLTVPMIGWVSGTREGACSYPVTDLLGAANNAAPQDATQVHWLDSELFCGNGYRDGEFVGAVDPTLTSIAADENFAADWVRELVSRHGLAREGGVEIYALGNEPGLWHSTHGDIRPTPMGREELISTNVAYAAAIKTVDPSAEVIGPVLWSGYSYYVTSEELLINDLRPGDVPTFIGDYLAAMADAEQQQGTRLIDRLAINFYDDRVYNAGTDTLRLEATRQLWDPEYAPSDWWVTRDFLYGNGSAVIPRMYELIEQHYPGTKLAITEYNFGGPDTLAGALAQADALGIFGREALDMATVWEPYADWLNMTVETFSARPIIYAFRLYRNYDGEGSQFGNQSLLATSSDQDAVSIYAARRNIDDALTVVLINKSTQEFKSPLRGITGLAEQYRYDGADLADIVRNPDLELFDGVELELPARSATLLVVSDDEASGHVESQLTVANGAQLIEAPATTAEGGALDSSTTSFVWREAQALTLSAPLTINSNRTGTLRGNINDSIQIAAGTTICSYAVHADRIRDSGRLTGSLRIDGETLLGIITATATLRASDYLGAKATEYVYHGLEGNDRLTISSDDSGTAVQWSLGLGAAVDTLRIVTECRGG